MGEKDLLNKEGLARLAAEMAARKKKAEPPAPVEVAKEPLPPPSGEEAPQKADEERRKAKKEALVREYLEAEARRRVEEVVDLPARKKVVSPIPPPPPVVPPEPSPAAEKAAPAPTGLGFEGEEPGKPTGRVERGQEEDIGAMIDNIMKNRRVYNSNVGESLETAHRLCDVGNYEYARDLVGYLIAQNPSSADLLRPLYNRLDSLTRIPPAPAPRRTGGDERQAEIEVEAGPSAAETPQQRRIRVMKLMEKWARDDDRFYFIDAESPKEGDAWIADIDIEKFCSKETTQFINSAIQGELGNIHKSRLRSIHFAHEGISDVKSDADGNYWIILRVSKDDSWKNELIMQLREVKRRIDEVNAAARVAPAPPLAPHEALPVLPESAIFSPDADVPPRVEAPPEFKTGPAIWHDRAFGEDWKINVISYWGIEGGRHYVTAESTSGSVWEGEAPLDEIEYSQTVGKDPRLRFIPGPAIWHSADGDIAVTVVRYAGFDSNDRPYVFIQGRDTPVALEEIEFPTPLPEEEGDKLDKFVAQISSWWRKMKGKDQRGWMEEGKRLAAESASRFFTWLESGVKDRGRTYDVDRVEAPEERKIKRASELIDHVESSDERLKFDTGNDTKGFSKWWDTIDLEKFCSDRNIAAIQQIIRFELGEDEGCLEEIAFVTKDKKSSIDVAHGKIRIQVVFEEEWKEVLRQHLRGLLIGNLIEQAKEDEPRLQFGHEPAHEDKKEDGARHKEEHFDPLEWISIPAIPDLCKPDSLYEIRGMITGILGKYERRLKKIRLHSEARESYVNVKIDAHEGVIDLYINQPNQWKVDPNWWKNALRKGLQLFKTECEHIY